jgi:hypothetical protein
VHKPVSDLEDEEHVDPLEYDCAVHVEEVTRQIVGVWTRRNCRPVMSVLRTSAGGIRYPPPRGTRRIVDAPTR